MTICIFCGAGEVGPATADLRIPTAVCQGEYRCSQCGNGHVETAQRGFLAPQSERRDNEFAHSGRAAVSNLQFLASLPLPDLLSQSLDEASLELECRLEMGEFDDLDVMQLNDLRALNYQLAQWAARALRLEQGHPGSPAHPMGHGRAAVIPGSFAHVFRY